MPKKSGNRSSSLAKEPSHQKVNTAWQETQNSIGQLQTTNDRSNPESSALANTAILENTHSQNLKVFYPPALSYRSAVSSS